MSSRRCPNCSTPLVEGGKYCVECGQRDTELRLPVRKFVDELLESLLKIDNKLWPTLRCLFVPGFLTQEHRLGRRARYHRPIALFFVAAGLLLSVRSCDQLKAPVDSASGKKLVSDGFRHLGEGLMTRGEESMPADQIGAFRQRETSLLGQMTTVFYFLRSPKGLLLYVVLLAFVMRGYYRKRGIYFAEHVVYALHVEAFGALVQTVARVSMFQHAMAAASVISFVFGVFALKRVYNLNTLSALRDAAAIQMLQLVAIALIATIVILPVVLYLLLDTAN